eukprot:3087230-Pyramimonas_sp.AAC.1
MLDCGMKRLKAAGAQRSSASRSLSLSLRALRGGLALGRAANAEQLRARRCALERELRDGSCGSPVDLWSAPTPVWSRVAEAGE